jgi:hypothetical protein
MSALAETLRALSRVLDARGLGWFVFGAQAVAVRGAPRTTQDVDVTVDVSRDQLPELIGGMAQEGLQQRYPEIAEKLLAEGAVVPLQHRSGMEVDMVLAGSGLEALALSRATRVTIADVDVPVAHATDLVVMKVLAGRGKDLDDVRALLASGDVDLVEARDLLSQLEQALGQSDLLVSFDAIVTEEGGS